MGSPSKSWAGPGAAAPVAAAPPDPDEALAQHLRFAAAAAAAADAAPCAGSRRAPSESSSGPVLSAGRMEAYSLLSAAPSGAAAGPPRPTSCGDASSSSRPPSGGAYRPPSGSTQSDSRPASDSRPPSGGSGCSMFSATCAPAAPPTIIGGSFDLQAQQQQAQAQAQQQQAQAQQQQAQATPQTPKTPQTPLAPPLRRQPSVVLMDDIEQLLEFTMLLEQEGRTPAEIEAAHEQGMAAAHRRYLEAKAVQQEANLPTPPSLQSRGRQMSAAI